MRIDVILRSQLSTHGNAKIKRYRRKQLRLLRERKEEEKERVTNAQKRFDKQFQRSDTDF